MEGEGGREGGREALGDGMEREGEREVRGMRSVSYAYEYRLCE